MYAFIYIFMNDGSYESLQVRPEEFRYNSDSEISPYFEIDWEIYPAEPTKSLFEYGQMS